LSPSYSSGTRHVIVFFTSYVGRNLSSLPDFESPLVSPPNIRCKFSALSFPFSPVPPSLDSIGPRSSPLQQRVFSRVSSRFLHVIPSVSKFPPDKDRWPLLPLRPPFPIQCTSFARHPFYDRPGLFDPPSPASCRLFLPFPIHAFPCWVRPFPGRG